MNIERPIVTPQDIERYRAEARAMQSREIARLVRLLFGTPARLFRRAGRRSTDAVPADVRHA